MKYLIQPDKSEIVNLKAVENASDKQILENMDDLFEWLEDACRSIAFPLGAVLKNRFYLVKDKMHQVFSKETLDGNKKSSIMHVFFSSDKKNYFKEENFKPNSNVMLSPTTEIVGDNIGFFCSDEDKKNIAEFKTDLLRIVNDPTPSEKADGADITAEYYLDELNETN